MMRQTNFTFLIKYYTIFKVFIHKEDRCSFFLPLRYPAETEYPVLYFPVPSPSLFPILL